MGLASWTVPSFVHLLEILLTNHNLPRYRITAALNLLLMQGGYKSPHRTINIYVTTYTAFRPNDGGPWVGAEPNLSTDIKVERILGSKLCFERMCKSFIFLYLYIQVSFYDSFATSHYACGCRFHSIRLWKLFSELDRFSLSSNFCAIRFCSAQDWH